LTPIVPPRMGERKQVTVLFADMTGSMELLADRDREEARKLLEPALERMIGVGCGGSREAEGWRRLIQLLGCDFAIAAEVFSLSEINWGILPGSLVSKVVSDALLATVIPHRPAVARADYGGQAAPVAAQRRTVS